MVEGQHIWGVWYVGLPLYGQIDADVNRASLIRPNFSSAHLAIILGEVARCIKSVHAFHAWTPARSHSAGLHLFVRVGAQLDDAIDRHRTTVTRGAVLRRSVELTLLLEDAPGRSCRADVALDGVGRMRSPGSERRVRVKEVQLIEGSRAVSGCVCEEPPFSEQRHRCGVERFHATQNNALQPPLRRKADAAIQLHLTVC